MRAVVVVLYEDLEMVIVTLNVMEIDENAKIDGLIYFLSSWNVDDKE